MRAILQTSAVLKELGSRIARSNRPARSRAARSKNCPLPGLGPGLAGAVGDELVRPRHARVQRLDVPPHQVADVRLRVQLADRPQRRRRHDGVAHPARLDDQDLLRRSDIGAGSIHATCDSRRRRRTAVTAFRDVSRTDHHLHDAPAVGVGEAALTEPTTSRRSQPSGGVCPRPVGDDQPRRRAVEQLVREAPSPSSRGSCRPGRTRGSAPCSRSSRPRRRRRAFATQDVRGSRSTRAGIGARQVDREEHREDAAMPTPIASRPAGRPADEQGEDDRTRHARPTSTTATAGGSGRRSGARARRAAPMPTIDDRRPRTPPTTNAPAVQVVVLAAQAPDDRVGRQERQRRERRQHVVRQLGPHDSRTSPTAR